jgi:hypothetical protein
MRDVEHSPGWIAANSALWLFGTAVLAAHGLALLLYGTGARASAGEAAQQQMLSEHKAVCDKLEIGPHGARREQCLDLLLQLQQRHEQSYSARMGDLF